MRLSLAVTLLVVSLSSCSTSAFGTPAHSLTSVRPFGTSKSSATATTAAAAAFCRGSITRGGGSRSALQASPLLSEEVVLSANLDLLSERGRAALTTLIENDDGAQKHVYSGWPEPGTDDDGKRRLADQVRITFCKCYHTLGHYCRCFSHALSFGVVEPYPNLDLTKSFLRTFIETAG